MARILQNHEQNIIKNGSVSEGLAQYVNALFQENENAKAWVGSLMRDSQAQSEALRQHHLGQQVLAEAIKEIIGQQQQQQQMTAGGRPVVTEIDDDNRVDQDFQSGPNPRTRPPDRGAFGVPTENPQGPMTMEIVTNF